MKKKKPESLAGGWEICDVRQRHIKIWCSAEIKVDRFRGRTGPRSQSVDETPSDWTKVIKKSDKKSDKKVIRKCAQKSVIMLPFLV